MLTGAGPYLLALGVIGGLAYFIWTGMGPGRKPEASESSEVSEYTLGMRFEEAEAEAKTGDEGVAKF